MDNRAGRRGGARLLRGEEMGRVRWVGDKTRMHAAHGLKFISRHTSSTHNEYSNLTKSPPFLSKTKLSNKNVSKDKVI